MSTPAKQIGWSIQDKLLADIVKEIDQLIKVTSKISGAGGDMVLASVQTNTGAKTFLDTTLLLRNVANTFDGSFTNINSANRIYTLQDRAGTLADDTDLGLKANLTSNTFTGTQSMTSPAITTSITTPSTTFNLVNTTATTGNLFGAANVAVNIGANGGTASILNPTVTLTNATALNINGASPSIVSSSTGSSFVFNTNILTGNLFGAATTVTIGATTGTANIRNTTVALAGGTLTGAATQNVFNTVSTTVNAFGAATTSVYGGTPTTALTATFFGNATATGVTKTVNIATAGASGSTTNVNIGSSVASAILGTISLNAPTVLSASNNTTVALWNTNATTINFGGAVTGTLSMGNATGLVASAARITAPNLIGGFSTTATAAATTTLTVTSNYINTFTGATTQTVTLPVVTTLVNGHLFRFVNLSSDVVTVQSSGANSIKAMAANSMLDVWCINTAGGTGTGSWNWQYTASINN